MSDAIARVLVIDDEVVVADTLVLVLNQSGFDAIAAYNGEHGLECARQVACDHLVSDVVMEPMNGIEAAIAIKAAIPHCKVLLMSGDPRTTQLLTDAAKNGHHFEILAKPVHPTEILDRLRAAGPKISAD